MKSPTPLTWVLSLLVVVPALAQDHEPLLDSPRALAAPAQTALIYDDGEADNGFRPTFPNESEYAMRFTAPASSNPLLGLSFCLQRLPGAASSGEVEVRLYRDGGAGPGSVIDAFSASVTNVTTTTTGRFHVFDLARFNVILPRTFYIGVRLDSLDNDFFLCVDHDGVAGPQTLYASVNQGVWQNFRNTFPEVRAFMIRAAVETADAPPPPPPPSPGGSCDAGPDGVSLLGGRFRVDVCWRRDNGETGVGKLAGTQGSGATLWFFNRDNPEIFLKVRNACVAPFNRYWFFAAGLTNVGVTVKVTDTQTGVAKTYENPVGRAFQSVQDTTSFDTCP